MSTAGTVPASIAPAVALGLAAALGLGLPAARAQAPGASDARAAAWLAGGCALCHEVPGQARASRQDSCADCHAWIRTVAANPEARARALAVFPLWERYERTVATYMPVPSLAAAMARLEPAWVDGYLQDPHDLRPGLPEGMPRFALTDSQRAELVAAFAQARATAPPSAEPDGSRVETGARLFVERGCAACHSLGAAHAESVLPQAPDLAHARERMHPDMVAAWIRDPRAISSAATMPGLSLPEDEVLALRDYVLLSPLDATPVASGQAALPSPATEPVAWAQVEERVFGRICVHCHMDPAQNQGRSGPGNAGGFGWAATGIELQTYEGVVAAADRIPDSLLRRRHEAARDHVAPGELPAVVDRPERPGMPLGLPPLSDEDTALVLGWIAQGMPR